MMFTCKYTDSYGLLKDYYYRVKMRLNVIWAAVGVVLSVACLGIYFLSWELWDLFIPVFGGYYTVKQMIAPMTAAKKDMKQLHDRFGGQVPQRVCTVDDKGVVCTLDDRELTLLFEDVLAVYDMKSALVVEGMDSAILLAKEGFEAGQAEACLAHIRENCPHCPHYKR